jgi:hypothetical protein
VAIGAGTAAVEAVGDRASNTGQGIGIAPQGHGVAQGVFKVGGFQKGDQGGGDGALAGLVKGKVGAQVRQGGAEVIAEVGGDGVGDRPSVFAVATEPDGGGGGLGSSDALGQTHENY